MKVATRKLRSPLKWHGGKAYLARRIVALMPRHGIYTEAFAGGLNVLLNKPRAEFEVVGDLDPRLALFWKVVACEDDPEGCRFERFRSRLWFNKYEPSTFSMARHFIQDPPWPLDQVDRALYAAFFLMWNRMSRGGLGKDFGWSKRLRGGKPGDLNAWETTLQSLFDVQRRMNGVTVSHSHFATLISQHDTPETLHYCDPPYLHETRTTRNAYTHEMSRDDHVRLLNLLLRCRGAVMLSGYRSELYDEALMAWSRVDFEIANHASQRKTKQRRVECLWINRPIPQPIIQES